MCLTFYGVFHKTWERNEYKLNLWINLQTPNFKHFITRCTYNALLCVLCCMRDFQYGGLNSHNSAMPSPYFPPNKICKSEICNWASTTFILSLSFNESFNFKVSERGRMESLPAPRELDTTLTPSVRASHLDSASAGLELINDAPVSDTWEDKKDNVGM